MAKKPVLVVMAAGMGSRYGGLKQIDPVGSCGEAILDYSLFDAYEAGFETAVIIIKEAIQRDFMDTVGARLKRCPMEIRYAYQELDKLPEGYTVPEERIKPWGTGHAVLCAAEEIGDAPFAVINADDYYGKTGFRENIYSRQGYVAAARRGIAADAAPRGHHPGRHHGRHQCFGKTQTRDPARKEGHFPVCGRRSGRPLGQKARRAPTLGGGSLR